MQYIRILNNKVAEFATSENIYNQVKELEGQAWYPHEGEELALFDTVRIVEGKIIKVVLDEQGQAVQEPSDEQLEKARIDGIKKRFEQACEWSILRVDGRRFDAGRKHLTNVQGIIDIASHLAQDDNTLVSYKDASIFDEEFVLVNNEIKLVPKHIDIKDVIKTASEEEL